MRLLLLLPNFVLMAISGYNLTGNAAWQSESNNLAYTLLHLFVMALCLVFMVFIIKSVVKVGYVEIPEDNKQEDETYGAIHI